VDGKPAQQAGILPSSGLTCITVHQAGSYAWLQRAHLAAPGWEHHDCQHEALWNKGCAMGGVCVEGEGGGGGHSFPRCAAACLQQCSFSL
jgi:hypothetical protein